MKILLVSATKFEILPLLANFKKIHAGKNLSIYYFGKHTVDVLITGVGMTAAAFHLGKTLNKKYNLAVNAGVAGSFKKNIPLGTVVNVVTDCFGDLGAEDGEEFLTLKEMGLEKVTSYKLQVTSVKLKKAINSLPKVKAITVNTAHGNPYSIKKVQKKFNPDIESMEGAAFVFSCDHEKISCIQIRTVSNYVERRNKKKWEMNSAVRNLNLFLLEFMNKI
ncbi:MAG: futalosine hydrolase [Bacteroidia bacterium]